MRNAMRFVSWMKVKTYRVSNFSFLLSAFSFQDWVIFAKRLHARFKYGIEFIAHTTGAGTNTGLERTCRVEVDA